MSLILVSNLQSEEALVQFLCEAFRDLRSIETKDCLVGKGLLNSNLYQSFSCTRFVDNCLKDLKAFQILIALEAQIFAILLKTAAS